jgi:hypothetical protein
MKTWVAKIICIVLIGARDQFPIPGYVVYSIYGITFGYRIGNRASNGAVRVINADPAIASCA